jgi:hypothetical protein
VRPLIQVVVQQRVLADADEAAHRARAHDRGGRVLGPLARDQVESHRHEQQQNELTAVDDARRRVGRQRGRDQREGGIERQRQGEARRGRPPLLDDEERCPANHRERQQSVGDADRELHDHQHGD